jgi:hypothetical protein
MLSLLQLLLLKKLEVEAEEAPAAERKQRRNSSII